MRVIPQRMAIFARSMSSCTRYVLPLLTFIAFGGICRAQVVNIEGRRMDNDSVPWSGFVNFRFNVAENGQHSLGFGLDGAVQHNHGRNRYLFINDLAFSQVEDNSFLNTGFQHLRYNYRIDSLWTGEAFVQTQYNKPLQLDFRLTVGVGPRLTVIHNKQFKLNLGTSLMYENEYDTDAPAFSDGRSSSYVSGSVNFSEVASLTVVVYYQPKLFDASDHRISLESGFLLNITKRMTLESRLRLLKDTAQPEGVPSLTYSWNNLFGFKF